MPRATCCVTATGRRSRGVPISHAGKQCLLDRLSESGHPPKRWTIIFRRLAGPASAKFDAVPHLGFPADPVPVDGELVKHQQVADFQGGGPDAPAASREIALQLVALGPMRRCGCRQNEREPVARLVNRRQGNPCVEREAFWDEAMVLVERWRVPCTS